MSKMSLDTYRKQWPRMGGVLAIGLGGATALAARRMTKPQVLSALNFAVLLVHQYEEYQDPGYFPGQLNRGVFKSDSPRNFPLNTNTAMCVNTALGYPFYAAPVLFPKTRWVGLGPAFFGMSQAVAHGIIFPRRAGVRYSPGFLTSILLHVPLGIAYIKALNEAGPISRGDWAKGFAYQFAFGVIGLAGPIFLGRDKHSLHAFTRAQMGPYDTASD